MPDDRFIHTAALAIAAAIRSSPCHYRAEVWPEDGESFLIRVTGLLSGPFACYPARFDLGLRMDAEAICFTALRADYGPRDDSGKHLDITLYPFNRRHPAEDIENRKVLLPAEMQEALRFLKLADQALIASEQLVELWEEKLLRLIEPQLPPPIRIPGNERFLDQLRAVLCELGVEGLPPASEW